jgi:hypothetical protein
MPSQTEDTIRTVSDIVLPIASVATAFFGGPALLAIVQIAAKYGPDAALGIARLFEKKDVVLADVEQAFSALKPYSAYGIPDKIPVAPVV